MLDIIKYQIRPKDKLMIFSLQSSCDDECNLKSEIPILKFCVTFLYKNDKLSAGRFSSASSVRAGYLNIF